MLEAERLPDLAPSLVIVQAGHDDGGVPARVERRQVLRTIDLIRADDPRARIALLTVFSLPTGPVSPALDRADRAIVTAARDADPRVIIMDPLTGHWKFQHAHEGLHPTAAGDAWIARKVASILRAHGVSRLPADRHQRRDLRPQRPRKAALSPALTPRRGSRSALAPDRTRQGRAPGTWPESQAAKTVAAAGSTASRNSSHRRSRAATISLSLTSARPTGLDR